MMMMMMMMRWMDGESVFRDDALVRPFVTSMVLFLLLFLLLYDDVARTTKEGKDALYESFVLFKTRYLVSLVACHKHLFVDAMVTVTMYSWVALFLRGYCCDRIPARTSSHVDDVMQKSCFVPRTFHCIAP